MRASLIAALVLSAVALPASAADAPGIVFALHQAEDGSLFLLSGTSRILRQRGPDGPLEEVFSLDDLSLYNLVFDGSRAVAVGQLGTAVLTDDGGGSWKRLDSGTDAALLDVAFVGRRIYVAGTHGALLYSDDDGASWQDRTSSYITFFDLQFQGDEGWAVGEFQTVLHTADRGDSWETLSGGSEFDFFLPPYFAVAESDGLLLAAGLNGAVGSLLVGDPDWQVRKESLESSVYALEAATVAGREGFVGGDSEGRLIFLPADDPGCVLTHPVQERALLVVEVHGDQVLAAGEGGAVHRLPLGSTFDPTQCPETTGGADVPQG